MSERFRYSTCQRGAELRLGVAWPHRTYDHGLQSGETWPINWSVSGLGSAAVVVGSGPKPLEAPAHEDMTRSHCLALRPECGAAVWGPYRKHCVGPPALRSSSPGA